MDKRLKFLSFFKRKAKEMPWELQGKPGKYKGKSDWDTSSTSMSSTSSTPGACSLDTMSPTERLVKRLKNTNPDKFATMVKMHLSFLLDLPGSSLEEFLGDTQAQTIPVLNAGVEKTQKSSGGLFSNFGKRRNTSKESKQMSPTTPGGVFGVELTAEVIDRLFPLMDYLSKPHSLQEEGLFRKSGHIGRQRALKERLQAGEDDLSDFTPHDCASVLKTFLADMPEPLLTEKHYTAYCQLPAMKPSKQLQTVQLLVQLLPKQNLVLLEYLLELLHTVAEEDSNKMTAETLGMLFAPTILAPRKMIPKDLHQVSPNINQAVAFMVQHAHFVGQVPEALVTDIKSYWDEMEEVRKSTDSMDSGFSAKATAPRLRKRVLTTSDNAAITTAITFADRVASQQAAASTDTETALAQLYAHVSSMPESAKKRKLLKQFNKANGVRGPNTPPANTSLDKHKRSRSLGESIKKMVGRGHHRRRCSGHASQVQNLVQASQEVSSNPCQYTSPCPVIIKRPPVSTPCHTPVQKLFADRLRADIKTSTNSSGARISNSSITTTTTSTTATSTTRQETDTSSSPRVHIVELNPHRSSISSMSPCQTTGKRKYSSTVDSPMLSAAATQTSMSMLADFLNNTPKGARKSTDNKENAVDKENQAPQAFVSPISAHKLATASPCRKIYSPISHSVTRAPKSVQQCVATPGSRQPVALVNTP